MSHSRHLTREELLEMAELDANGALDEVEETLFQRALLNAPSGVQEEIRNLQASICADESLLVDEEPGHELKLSVLAAVAQAIDEENRKQTPLAKIGGGVRLIESATPRSNPMPLHLWRAAAFALAAGLLVCLFFLGKVVDTNQQLARVRIHEGYTPELAVAVNVALADLVRRPHRTIPLLPVGNPDDLAVNPDFGRVYVGIERSDAALVVLDGLPFAGSSEFRIEVTTADGRRFGENAPTIQKLPNSAYAVAHIGKILPDVGLLATATIRIFDANGTLVLQSA